MAGSEKRGVEYARAGSVENATCILAPTPKTNAKALAKVDAFWRAIGMSTVQLSAEGA